MGADKFGIVVIRLFAVFIVIKAVQYLVFVTGFVTDPNTGAWNALIAVGLTLVFPLAIAAILWNLPSTILGKLSLPDETMLADDHQELLFVGIVLLGIYTLVFGIIAFVDSAMMHINDAANVRPGRYEVLPHVIGRYVTSIAQILLGSALILGRQGLSATIGRFRRAGVRSGSS